jgi:hypothetical protein
MLAFIVALKVLAVLIAGQVLGHLANLSIYVA